MIKNILAESMRAMNVGEFLGVIGVILSICFDSWNDLVRAFVNQNGCVHYFFWNSAYGGVCRIYLLPVFAAFPYAAQRYNDFLRRHEALHVLFLELGVGGNTPVLYFLRTRSRSTKNDIKQWISGHLRMEQETMEERRCA